jgi:hypothetical protein
MQNCRSTEKLIKKLISDELESEEKSRLTNHIRQCKKCGELYNAHIQLSSLESELIQTDSEAFSKIRRNVIQIIQQKESAKPIPWYQKLNDQIYLIFNRPAMVAASALLLFAAGFSLKSILTETTELSQSGLINQIKHTAIKNTDLQQVENSPFIFSDVKFNNIDGENMALSFNVTTHVDLVRHKDDPLLKEVLAQSLLNTDKIGNQLNAISYAKQIMDPKIKEALIFTLQNDGNLAVRTKAMTSLTNYPNDDQIQNAFLTILRSEESVNMRLMAIDYLTNYPADQKLLKDALQYMNSAEDFPVRYKLNQIIKN